jgi:hypothetical protein
VIAQPLQPINSDLLRAANSSIQEGVTLKKFFSVALFISTAIAFGQASVAPKAAELLEKAKTFHGGAALEGLKTFQETADLTYFNDKGQVAAQLTGVVKLDFATERVRVEIFQAQNLILIQQYDPKGSWDPKSGTLKLPKAEAETVRSSLYLGVPALKFGKNREVATADGPGGMLELKGVLVSLTTKGIKTSYLLDPSGLALAARHSSPRLGSLITTYSDVRDINGLKLPFVSKSYLEQAKNALFGASKTTEAKVNPVFTIADFEMPKK